VSAGTITATNTRTREAVGLGAVALVAWCAALWVSVHVQSDPALYRAALFVHLASLVAGFGAALTIDYFALQWLLGRRTLREVLTVSGGTSLLVWTGLTGLVGSGAVGRGAGRLPQRPVLSDCCDTVVALTGCRGSTCSSRQVTSSRRPPVLGRAAITLSHMSWGSPCGTTTC
jgi:hypothetical protein